MIMMTIPQNTTIENGNTAGGTSALGLGIGSRSTTIVL